MVWADGAGFLCILQDQGDGALQNLLKKNDSFAWSAKRQSVFESIGPFLADNMVAGFTPFILKRPTVVVLD